MTGYSTSLDRPGNLRAAATAVALLAAIIGGCGGDERPPDADADIPLDPPELAADEFELVPDGVVVLCYHYFRDSFEPTYLARVVGAVVFGMPSLGPREFWTTPIGEFERHLRFFRDAGIAVMTLDEIAALRARGGEPPERTVVLTIDDADVSVYELAYPLLRRYGYRAHLFVPTGHVGRPWAGIHVCDWEMLSEMAAAGTFVLGSHTHDLHFKVETGDGYAPVFLYPDAIPGAAQQTARTELRRRTSTPPTAPITRGVYAPVAWDLAASRAVTRAETGCEATYLAWPYGFANADLDSVAAAVGFRGSVSLHPSAWGPQAAPWHVGRYTITAKTTSRHIAALFAATAPAAGDGEAMADLGRWRQRDAATALDEEPER
jgi:peptidoglycan/xylan/chitin deacetylase (PgdA/CDA1 family)